MFYQSGYKDLQLASMKRALSQSQGSSKTRRTRKTTRKRRRRKKASSFLKSFLSFITRTKYRIQMLIFLRPQWTTYEGQLKEGQENGEEEGNRENVKTLMLKLHLTNFYVYSLPL